jgi:DNA-binding transcriptional ArsR family regulator
MALADPTRLRIFELVAQGEKNVGELVKQFPYKGPTISQHLRVLLEARLVKVRAQGQKRFYTVDEAGLQELETWVNAQKAHWDHNLNVLEQHLANNSKGEHNEIK